MQFTNKFNYPDYIAEWLAHDNYDHDNDPYTISATTLMKPTRATVLAIRHANRLEMDVSERVASKMGSAIHDSIEKISTKNIIKEVRTKRQISLGAVTYTVTGKFDVLEQHDDNSYLLRDIKTTSVWAYILGGKDEEYRKQLSIYRWLLSPDKNVKDYGLIDFFFTDWSSTKAKQDRRQYPQQRLEHGYTVNLLSLEETEQYILSRLQAIEDNKNKADDDLTPCSKQELWAGDEKFAVYKNGAKKASRVLNSHQEALDYQASKNIVGYIQRRPPKVKRCNYCSAIEFCNQGKSYRKQGLLD